jgi:hypothetical protein
MLPKCTLLLDKHAGISITLAIDKLLANSTKLTFEIYQSLSFVVKNNRLLSKSPDFVLEQGTQVRAAQHIQTYVRYAILLRALRGVLLRKTGKFAPSEFVSSAVCSAMQL